MAMKRKVVRRAWGGKDAQVVAAESIRFPDVNAAAKDVDVMEEFVLLNPPLDILEVACGNGRYAVEFAKRGYRVVGMDVEKQLIDQAEKAVYCSPGIQTVGR
jgi:2-polyprenyl-3-methyl-5-hydroxy-6-metoxy-1,4-benzoquinol methylase